MMDGELKFKVVRSRAEQFYIENPYPYGEPKLRLTTTEANQYLEGVTERVLSMYVKKHTDTSVPGRGPRSMWSVSLVVKNIAASKTSGRTTDVHQRFWILYNPGVAEQGTTDGSGIGESIRDKLIGAFSDRKKLTDELNEEIKLWTQSESYFWARLEVNGKNEVNPVDMKVNWKSLI